VEILRLVKNLQEKVQQTENKLEIITKDFTEKFTQLEHRLQKHSTEVDKQMEKLKAQEDKEFTEVHKICKQLECKFDDEQKTNKAIDFKEIVKEQMEEEMKKSACDNYRVSGALEKLEHETILQDRASDR